MSTDNQLLECRVHELFGDAHAMGRQVSVDDKLGKRKTSIDNILSSRPRKGSVDDILSSGVGREPSVDRLVSALRRGSSGNVLDTDTAAIPTVPIATPASSSLQVSSKPNQIVNE